MNGIGNNGKYNDVWEFIPDTTCYQPISSGQFSYTLSDSSICAGDSTLLTLNGLSNGQISPSSSASWSGASNIYLFPDSSTTYTVSGSSACGGSSSRQITIQVSSASVVVSSDSPNICPTDTATICATPGFSSYIWNTGQTTNCIITQTTGDYYVTASNAQGCAAESNHIAITVYPSPPVGYSQDGDTLVANGAATYQWYLNGQAISGANSQTYIAKVLGVYTLAVTDTNGCSARSSNIIVSGISDLHQDEISIYPNPLSAGNWQIDVNEGLIGNELQVFDDNGRLVYKSELNHLHSELQLNVARGVYLLQISSTHSSIIRKLVKL